MSGCLGPDFVRKVLRCSLHVPQRSKADLRVWLHHLFHIRSYHTTREDHQHVVITYQADSPAITFFRSFQTYSSARAYVSYRPCRQDLRDLIDNTEAMHPETASTTSSLCCVEERSARVDALNLCIGTRYRYASRGVSHYI